MAPRLRVLAGPSPDLLEPISDIVNRGEAHFISSPLFEGSVVVNIKGFIDHDGEVLSSEYFEREERKGNTWSIQVQGKFLKPYSADDILFGNTFDRPLHLPWGSGAALKFMKYIDPTLEHDLTSNAKPWALSPLISTMPYFAHKRIQTLSSSSSSESVDLDAEPTPRAAHFPKSSARGSQFPPVQSIKDYTSQLHLALLDSSLGDLDNSSSSSLSSVESWSSRGSNKSKKPKRSKRGGSSRQDPFVFSSSNERRSHFSDAKRRKEVIFGPEDIITTDFCYGFIEFNPSLALKLPGGISFDLMKYWDGQPVRFVCCERKRDGNGPWGRVFWCVSIEPGEEEDSSGGEAANETQGDDID